jgi:hypothetical protein
VNVLVIAILLQLVEEHEKALREAEYWNRRCALWTKAHGLAVWREGHPLDREKLRQRRIWRREAAATGKTLRCALATVTSSPE